MASKSEGLKMLQQQVADLQSQLAVVTQQRDKFRADFEQASRWQGVWKDKYLQAQHSNGSETLEERRARLAAAKAKAIATGAQVRA